MSSDRSLRQVAQDIYQLSHRDPVTGVVEPVPAARRIQALMEHPEAEALVRSLDPQSVGALIHEAGRDDAHDLILMLRPEQTQALLDLDTWKGDTLSLETLEDWLETLLQAEDEDFEALLRTLDAEVITTWVRQRLAILLWEEDEDVLDRFEGPVMSSPDGVYALVPRPQMEWMLQGGASEEDGDGWEAEDDTPARSMELMRLFLERIWALDIEEGHRWMEAARWEMTTDLMERAYQWRNARLADLGFVPREEALEVLAWRDPVAWARSARERALAPDSPSVVLTTEGRIPPVDPHLQVLEAGAFREDAPMLHHAMQQLPTVVDPRVLDGVVESLMAQLRALGNRIQAISGAPLADAQAMRHALSLVRDHLSLGLELAAGTDVTLAARVLHTHPLKEIHQAACSAIQRLARQAQALAGRGHAGLVEDQPFSLLDEADRGMLEGLLRRPLAWRNPLERATWESVRALEETAQDLALLGVRELALFGWAGMTHSALASAVVQEGCRTPVELVSWRGLTAGLALRLAAGEAADWRPLPLETLHRAQQALRADAAWDALTDRLDAWARDASQDDPAARVMRLRWAHDVVAGLRPLLEGSTDLPLEVATGALVIA
jgi:hypothetical protein